MLIARGGMRGELCKNGQVMWDTHEVWLRAVLELGLGYLGQSLSSRLWKIGGMAARRLHLAMELGSSWD